jgi:hypothetical protein
MRTRLVWTLAAGACVIVAAGVVLLWWRAGSGLGISVGLPVAATLIAPIVFYVLGAPPLHAGQSTPEQLQAAAQLLVSRQLHQWRTATITESALSGGQDTLDVPWIESKVGIGADILGEEATTMTKLAESLRTNQSRWLIVVGRSGSGKTTLVRRIIVHRLKSLLPGDAVPVFFPLSAWNPAVEGLYDWMQRRIGDDYPELRERSSYGPTAIPGLVERHMILPVLDELDVLSKQCRYSVLTSSDLSLQKQVVVTCRDEEFAEVSGTLALADTSVVRPDCAPPEEMMRFLQQVTDGPLRWVEVFDQLDKDQALAGVLRDPRIIYLASVIYRSTESNPSELIEVAKEPDPSRIEEYLLEKLIPAQVRRTDKRASGYPWYGDRSRQWLAFVANPRHNVIDPDFSEIAWWRLYRAVPYLSRQQVPLRALVASAAAWLVVALLVKGGSHYAQLTGLAYASAIAAACLFLSPKQGQGRLKAFSRPAWRWWTRRAVSRSWRLIAAAVTASLGFGFFIGLRIASTGHADTAIRTGAADGMVVGMVVMLTALISGLPRPLRADRNADVGFGNRPKPIRLSAALALGIPFGLLAGILAVLKHQQVTAPSLTQGLLYGVIIGLDFGVGTWLVRRIEAHFDLQNTADPLTGLRAERNVALLVPAILGLTFASAFGLSATLHWYPDSGVANGLVGIIVGSLASDWPIYIVACTLLALIGKFPIRAAKFLEFCQSNEILRSVLQSYRFREDPHRVGVGSEPKGPRQDIVVPAAHHSPDYRPDADVAALSVRLSASTSPAKLFPQHPLSAEVLNTQEGIPSRLAVGADDPAPS